MAARAKVAENQCVRCGTIFRSKESGLRFCSPACRSATLCRPRLTAARFDALAIRARAEMRLAEEYDAAQDRGEVRRANNEKTTSTAEAVSAADLGLRRDEIHQAGKLRDK